MESAKERVEKKLNGGVEYFFSFVVNKASLFLDIDDTSPLQYDADSVLFQEPTLDQLYRQVRDWKKRKKGVFVHGSTETEYTGSFSMSIDMTDCTVYCSIEQKEAHYEDGKERREVSIPMKERERFLKDLERTNYKQIKKK